MNYQKFLITFKNFSSIDIEIHKIKFFLRALFMKIQKEEISSYSNQCERIKFVIFLCFVDFITHRKLENISKISLLII